jgi:hypothetical protein
MDSPPSASTSVDAEPVRGRGFRHALDPLTSRRSLRRARRAADAEIEALSGHAPLRLAWRVDELVSPKNRLDLAHSLRSLVADASSRYLPSASPVNRPAVRSESARLLAIAERLADLERPVSARGVVRIDRLLADGCGPLYDRERAHELASTLDSTLEALERR